jgi:outer membrane receptor protein involved in Fe transport
MWRLAVVCLCTVFPILVKPVQAFEKMENELDLIYGNEDFVSIAAGHPQVIADAPAVATVITQADIRETGASTLSQLLETVPALHVSVSPIFYNSIYLVRGIYSAFNPHVLLMINGVPLTNLMFGNRGQVWGGMPVENIARVEVIRGPGSAVYGADAFSGVINIITKTKDDINDTESGLRIGSFDTRDAWVLHGGSFGKVDFAASLQLHTTDGQKSIIDADAQTQFDEMFGTSASLAPGSLNNQAKWLDTSLDMSHGKWRWRASYIALRDMGTSAGAGEALDPQGRGEADRFLFETTYHDPQFATFWDTTFQASYFDVSNRGDLVIYPPGAFSGAFPDGVIGNPYVFERHIRLGGSAFYTGFSSHILRIGAGGYYGDLYKAEETKNYNPDGSPIGATINVTDTADIFIPQKTRRVYYGYLQDEWHFYTDWSLTTGLRWDGYSDFGSTINPRLALVWHTKYDLTTKFLYGRAFRPPSFAESFVVNNPVTLGNPDLKPETIDTFEWVFDYHPSNRLNSKLSLFHYDMRDIIQFVPDPAPATTLTAQNLGEQSGHGFEWETAWNLSDSLKFMGNYAYQSAQDKKTKTDAGYAPQQQLYLRSDWRFAQNWRTTAQLSWVADRKRVAEDNRPPVDDYATFDLSLRWQTSLRDWEVSLIGNNIFDADAREPSPAPGRISNDLPLAGRSLFLEVRYAP